MPSVFPASAISAGGGTNCFLPCFHNCSINTFMSRGFLRTSLTPALAAEIRNSLLLSLESITILHLNANSGSETNLCAQSKALPVDHSASMITISGIVANAVASVCLKVEPRVTLKPSRSKVLASKLRRPSFSSAIINLAIFLPPTNLSRMTTSSMLRVFLRHRVFSVCQF